MKQITIQEFMASDLTIEDLTYEKMVQLWSVSGFSDAEIAEKCNVPKDKVARIRRDKYKINTWNKDEHIENVEGSKMTTREEANAIVAHVFRNGYLEELHSGIINEELLNPKYSRITNDEMKKLMIQCCEQMEKLLEMKGKDPKKYEEFMQKTLKNYCGKWEK